MSTRGACLLLSSLATLWLAGCPGRSPGDPVARARPKGRKADGGARRPPGGAKMLKDAFYPADESAPIPIDVAPCAIHPAHTSPPARAATAPGDGATRPFVNALLNSRSPNRLPDGELEAVWRRELDAGTRPAFVMQAGERIVAQGDSPWLLFDRAGKPLTT